MSLGAGLGKLAGKVFRIGHLGDFNDLMLAGTLCGVEMGLRARRRAAQRRRRPGGPRILSRSPAGWRDPPPTLSSCGKLQVRTGSRWEGSC